MTAYFIGAGASSGTFRRARNCPPVGAEFGASLMLSAEHWQRTYPGLHRVVRHIGLPLEDIGLERIWTCIDYYAKLRSALPLSPSWSRSSRATHDLKRALLRLYGSRCEELVERLPISVDYTLGWLLKNRLRTGDVLISFNYDTVVERLALRFGHDVRMTAKSKASVVQLAKPHGSVAWRMDWTHRNVRSAANGKPLVGAMAEEDVGTTLEPLLLGAVPIKSELIREVQQRYFPAVFDVVTAQWRVVTQAVRNADALVIVGYGFPSEDQYGRFLLSEAMRSRGRSSLPQVQFFELARNKHRTKAAIRAAFGEPKLRPRYLGRVTAAPVKRRMAG
jgi:hypothetical protein